MKVILWKTRTGRFRGKGIKNKIIFGFLILLLVGYIGGTIYLFGTDMAALIGEGLSELRLQLFGTESEKIVNFVRHNYLYISQISNFEEKAAQFLAIKDPDAEQVKQFIESVRHPDDPYTFVRTGEQYENYRLNEETPQTTFRQVEDDLYLVKVRSFTRKVYKEFEKELKKIPSTEEKSLIIDLRDNGGGSTYSVNQMLDLLLPSCVTNYEITRSGKIFEYRSDSKMLPFRNIFVFVNGNSASASEVMALALKKYLNNVYIIGSRTRGKGVGQKVYENKEKRYIIYLVEHYWNSMESNINRYGIEPDEGLEAVTDEEYMNKVYGILYQ